jgi:hypothetical protein
MNDNVLNVDLLVLNVGTVKIFAHWSIILVTIETLETLISSHFCRGTSYIIFVTIISLSV